MTGCAEVRLEIFDRGSCTDVTQFERDQLLPTRARRREPKSDAGARDGFLGKIGGEVRRHVQRPRVPGGHDHTLLELRRATRRQIVADELVHARTRERDVEIERAFRRSVGCSCLKYSRSRLTMKR